MFYTAAKMWTVNIAGAGPKDNKSHFIEFVRYVFGRSLLIHIPEEWLKVNFRSIKQMQWDIRPC
jgi:hypothetical protein